MIPPRGEISKSSSPMVSYFSDRVARKSLEPAVLDAGEQGLTLVFQLEKPLSGEDIRRIRLEAERNQVEPIAGTLAVLRVEASAAEVRIVVPPLPSDVIRLDTLFRAIKA